MANKVLPTLRLDVFSYTFYVDHTLLTRGRKFTYLTSTAASGTNTLPVQSITGFAINQILLVGEWGSEYSEIIKTHSATAPTGTTVTLASNLANNHFQDEKVYIIPWDQVALSRSTGISSQKSTLTTIGIQADQYETIYQDTTNTTGFGFFEFKETVGNTFSGVSKGVPYYGYDDNMVYSIKKRALDSINEKIDQDVITHEFLDMALWQGRREYHQSPGKRPFRRKFNTEIGDVATGMYRIALPANCEKPFTAENVFGVRIGTGPNLTYYDKKKWDDDFLSSAHTTLLNANTVGDKDLYLTDVEDFTSTGGSVTIEDDVIAYSASGLSATDPNGTLRISTQGKNNHAAGSDVWQNKPSTYPSNFTVFADPGGSAYIYFSAPINTLYVNQNIYCDYYSTILDKDSDTDVLDEPDYDMFVPYLAYRIKERKGKGIKTVKGKGGMQVIADDDYIMWNIKKANSLANEYGGAEIRIQPSVDHLPIPS